MLTSLVPLIAFVGLGLLAHLAEKRFPLRSYEEPKAWLLDALGFGLSAAVTVGCRLAFPHAFNRLPSLPGFAWMSAAAHFVDTRIPWPVAFVVSVVVLDFLLYLGHRLLHTSVLWHTHAAHHSVEHLYWFAGNRASPVHTALQMIWGFLLGLVWPVKGGPPAYLATTILYTCIQHFNHANIGWRLGKLEWLFVVPRYHFIHHGTERRLNDSNFGFLLTIWDRMFGTYTNPDDVPARFKLGLDYEVGYARLFLGLPPKPPAAG
jgi:sterol desaturase/sphingolipid hydroxylase (fatty acid hydroxylase superfamily)